VSRLARVSSLNVPAATGRLTPVLRALVVERAVAGVVLDLGVAGAFLGLVDTDVFLDFVTVDVFLDFGPAGVFLDPAATDVFFDFVAGRFSSGIERPFLTLLLLTPRLLF